MQALLADKVFVCSVMAILSFAITQGLKWVLVKPWTKKLKNDRARKAINSVIFLFPYGVGIALEILFSLYVTHTTPNLFIGALNGGAGHSVFALYERGYAILRGKFEEKKSHAKTDEEKALEEAVFGIVEDNKVDGNDAPKLKEFLEKVK